MCYIDNSLTCMLRVKFILVQKATTSPVRAPLQWNTDNSNYCAVVVDFMWKALRYYGEGQAHKPYNRQMF